MFQTQCEMLGVQMQRRWTSLFSSCGHSGADEPVECAASLLLGSKNDFGKNTPKVVLGEGMKS